MFAIFLHYTLPFGFPLIKIGNFSSRCAKNVRVVSCVFPEKCNREVDMYLVWAQNEAVGLLTSTYLFLITVLLYFLAIVSATSKGIDHKFSAYSELVGVC